MQQPQYVTVMPEGTKRETGKTAQQNNIRIARMVSDVVRTTLGPKGMDKMLVDHLGDALVTNDGATILKELGMEHPAAKMMVGIATTQEIEVGDGTTTAVVLAGELLAKSQELLDQNIHPTVIIKGFQGASQAALNLLEELSTHCGENGLLKIAETALTGKASESNLSHLAKLATDAIQYGILFRQKEDIKIEAQVGGSISDSQLIEGIVIDKTRTNEEMPSILANAKILVLDQALETKSFNTDAQLQITDPQQLQQFQEAEEKATRDMVEKIQGAGVNVIFNFKQINDIAQHMLAKEGILGIRNVRKEDYVLIAKATGAKVVGDVNDLKKSHLGEAGLVEERLVGNKKMIFVEGCKHPQAVTILVRGSTDQVVDEIKRAMEDALGVLENIVQGGKVVPGAGAIETELSLLLRSFAEGQSGRQQLAAKAFADAFEVIPRALAENAGIDPIDALTELRAAHANGNPSMGINVFTGEVQDALEAGIIEPLRVKTQAIMSAVEVVTMLLRIDDVIARPPGTGRPT